MVDTRLPRYLFFAGLICTLLLFGCSDEDGDEQSIDPNRPDTNTPTTDVGDAGDASDAADVDSADTGADASTDVEADGDDQDAADADAGCQANDPQTLCAAEGYACGTLEVTDNCGTERTVNCGDESTVCDEHDTCGGGGVEGQCGCTPITCEEAGVLCGEIDDGCGGTENCQAFCVDTLFADYAHSCAVGSGKVKCWGQGRNGRLGTGSTGNAANPTDVQGLSADVIDVAIGERHSCAVTSNAEVKCWGANDVGQLGTGTTVGSDAAGSAAITTGATEVVAGVEHTCAVVNQAVYCWGAHSYGQIGDPSYDYTATVGLPKPVPDLQSGVIKLAAGSHHTCALLASGEVSCWGRNNYGQLGSGLQKFELEGGSGDTVYGFDSGGAATWSIEEPRRVAHPTDPPPASLSDITDIYAGPTYSCALNASNELYCWGALVGGSSCTGNASTCPYFPDPSGAGGYAVAQVELDNDDEYVVDNLHAERAAVVPLRVGAGFDIQAAGAGSRHLCLVVDEADTSLTNIYCLGHNDKGQLGDGSTNSWRTPTELAPDVDGNIVRALAIVGADSHTCALVDNNNAKCWGSNENGQIGNSDLQREQSYQPFDVKLNSSQ